MAIPAAGRQSCDCPVCMIMCMAVASLAQTSELPFNFMGEAGGDSGQRKSIVIINYSSWSYCKLSVVTFIRLGLNYYMSDWAVNP